VVRWKGFLSVNWASVYLFEVKGKVYTSCVSSRTVIHSEVWPMKVDYEVVKTELK